MACMSTSGSIHGELLRLIFILCNKQVDDYFAASVIRRTKRSFVTVASSSYTVNGAPSGWHVLRLWRYVVLPPPRVATSLALHMAYDDHDRNVSHIHGFAKDM